MLGLDQRHALKTFWASVGEEEGHEGDCILALPAAQAEKAVKFTPPLADGKSVVSPASGH